MTKRHLATLLPVLIIAMVFTANSVQADWGVSFGYSGGSGYSYYGDRITTEYRRGYQVDDWVERGSSSITDSPFYADGIRLAAWSTRYEDDYDYALASAIYFFEIPDNARSIRIKVSYDGEGDRGDFGDEIAGRIWIRQPYIDRNYQEYYPTNGRYQDVDEPLYGDTYVLRANKHLEIIRIPADDHVQNGMMELHVVAEGRQRLDVKYIEVESYTSLPSVRVVTRYYRDYTWRPWYNYTYWYFYTGPTFHFGDYYYVRYTYPRYRTHYVEIRKRYNDYLKVYYVRRPERRVRWAHVGIANRKAPRRWDRSRLSRWTREHEDARKTYRVISTQKRRHDDINKSRSRIRSVITSHSRPSPSIKRAKSGVTVRRTRTTTRTATSISGSRSRAPSRTGTQSSSKVRRTTRDTPSVRRRTTTSPNASSRIESRTNVDRTNRTRVESSRSSSTRSRSSSTRIQRNTSKSPNRAPARNNSSSSSKSKERRVRTRTSSRSSSSDTKAAPKKDDDDDDEEKRRRSTRSSSSSSSSRSSSSGKTRSRTRTR